MMNMQHRQQGSTSTSAQTAAQKRQRPVWCARWALMGCVLLQHGAVQAKDWLTLQDTTITGVMGLTSNYKFRGVDTGTGGAAIFGALTAARASGGYGTLWASSNGDAANGSEYRLRLGYATRLDMIAGLDATLDVHLTDYIYTGSSQDFYELGAQLAANNFWRPKGVGYAGLALSNDYLNRAGHSVYAYAGYTQPIQSTEFNLLAELGVLTTQDSLWINAQGEGKDLGINYRLGIQTQISGVDVEMAYVGARVDDAYCLEQRCHGAGVLTLKKIF